MSSFIPVAEAALMNLKFRQNRNTILKPEYQNQNILPICETFEKSQIETLFAKPGCTGLRVYYGADNDLKMHAVLVGVNSNNEDILPASPAFLTNVEDDYIIERGVRCPEECPPESELNQP